MNINMGNVISDPPPASLLITPVTNPTLIRIRTSAKLIELTHTPKLYTLEDPYIPQAVRYWFCQWSGEPH